MTGSKAQNALAHMMKTPVRTSTATTGGAWRAYRIPARVAPITRSAGSTVRGVSRRHRYTTTRTATNDAALSAKTSAGPLAATRMPPRAGPIARPMLMGSAFNATADISSDDGTSSPVIACQVGVFIATPIPSAKVRTSSIVAVMTSAKASTASRALTASIHVWVTSNSRRRSTMSATAPAGSPTTKTGRLVALCTRATINGDGESEVIDHAAPTFCIHVPTLEMSEAIHSARNTGCDSGAQAAPAVPPLPPILQLDVEVCRIMASSTANRIADLEADDLEGGREVRPDRPVGSELPVHPGPPPRLPGRARDGHVGLDVHGVRRGFTPLHAGGNHQRHVRDRLGSERGLQMDQVHVTRVAGEREVVAVRKERVERAECLVPGLVIARRGIDLEAQTRRPGEVGKSVAAAAADGPGADVCAPHISELGHRLDIPVEAASRAGVSHIEVVTPLVPAGVDKASIVSNEARVIRREVTGADVLALGPHASVLEMFVGEVIEEMLMSILNRQAPEPYEAPFLLLPVHPCGVVGLSDVGAIADRNEAL